MTNDQPAAVDDGRLESWCRRELGSAPVRALFAAGHLATVVGVELDDHRQVVIKVRQHSERLAPVVSVQRHLFDDYQRRRGSWQKGDRELAWAAGLWVLLYNAKKGTAGGGAGYLQHIESEFNERMRRTGA